jgi:hypothetical protein
MIPKDRQLFMRMSTKNMRISNNSKRNLVIK